jgi:hypothetical protein
MNLGLEIGSHERGVGGGGRRPIRDSGARGRGGAEPTLTDRGASVCQLQPVGRDRDAGGGGVGCCFTTTNKELESGSAAESTGYNDDRGAKTTASWDIGR